MKQTNYSQYEVLNKVFETTIKISNETVKAIIDSNSKQLVNSINSNQEYMDLIGIKISSKGLDPSMVPIIKKTFANGISLSEQMIDTIIDQHSKQLETAIEFNKEIIEILREQKFNSPEESELTIELIRKNFEKNFNESVEVLKNLIHLNNEHINIALNFDKKFGDIIKNQIDLMKNIQTANSNKLNNLISEWWKQPNTKVEAMI